MRHNLKMHLAYDGSSYFGWQKTSEGPSIEAELQQVLEKIFQHPITLQAASRTDAGVHAEDQVVNFFTEKEDLHLEKWLVSINQLLPHTIRVYSLERASENFHPTLDAKAKEYHYHLSMEEWLSPFKRNFVWHFPKQLDLELMQQAAKSLIGKRDFQALTNARKESYQDTVREIFSIHIVQREQDLIFHIKGDHFLYKMVRNIIGTLCYIGCHKLSLEDLSLALTSKKRALMGMTAPASGLVLKKVYYEHQR